VFLALRCQAVALRGLLADLDAERGEYPTRPCAGRDEHPVGRDLLVRVKTPAAAADLDRRHLDTFT
jgi:hypothetical protein